MATVSGGIAVAHHPTRPALFADSPAHNGDGEENLYGRLGSLGHRNLGVRGTSAHLVATLEQPPSGNSLGSTAVAGSTVACLSDTYGRPSSSEGVRHSPTRGLINGVPEPTRRQLEALEDRLGASIASLCRQQAADRQEADRLTDLSCGRLLARVDRSEQQQVRLERRISELAGVVKGFDDEAQLREARSERERERLRNLQTSLKQEQESLHTRLCDLEQDQKAVVASMQTASHANEDAQRHSVQRIRQAEIQLEEYGRSLDALGREAHSIHERIDSLESMNNRNADASLGNVCDQELAETVQGTGHSFSTGSGKAEARDVWSLRGPNAGEEAFIAMQEIEAVHQQLQALQDQCCDIQEVVDVRLSSQLRRLERKVGDHEAKVDQLLGDGQDCSAKVEEHEVRLGVTRSKIDAHDQRLALINDRLDRVLKLEKGVGSDVSGSKCSLQSEDLRCRELRELRDRVETSLISFSEKTSPALQEVRELRCRVESCEQQLSSSALASTLALSSASNQGSTLRGSLPLPQALERRLQSWESTLNELTDRFEQQSSALARDGSLAERALKHADAATVGLEDLAAKINKLAKLGEVSRTGFKDVSGHLEAISDQFGQLRERVQRHEEGLAAASSSKVKSEELTRVEEQTRDNSAMITKLSRSILCVREMLTEVKKTLDIALLERKTLAAHRGNNTPRQMATNQHTNHISHDVLTRIEDIAGKALERSREAAHRTNQIEEVVASLTKTFDSRLRSAESQGHVAHHPESKDQAISMQGMKSEIISLTGKLEIVTAQWSSMVRAAGIDADTNARAFEHLGRLLKALPETAHHNTAHEKPSYPVEEMKSEIHGLNSKLETVLRQWNSLTRGAGFGVDTDVAAFESLGNILHALPESASTTQERENQACVVAGMRSEVTDLNVQFDALRTQWRCMVASAGLDDTNSATFEKLGRSLHTVLERANHNQDNEILSYDMRGEVNGLNVKLEAIRKQWSSMVVSAGLGDEANAVACENVGKSLQGLPEMEKSLQVLPEMEKQLDNICKDVKSHEENLDNSLQRVNATIDEIFARLNSREGEEVVHLAVLTRMEQAERAIEEQRQWLEQRLEQGTETAGRHGSLNHVHPPEVGGGGHNRGVVMQGEAAGGGPVSRVTQPIMITQPSMSSSRPTTNMTTPTPHVVARWEGAEAEMSAGLHGMTRRAETEAETSAGPFPSPTQARRLQVEVPPPRQGEVETSESHVTGGDGAGGSSPSHLPPTPTNRNPLPHVHLAAEGDGAGGPNAIRTLEVTLAEDTIRTLGSTLAEADGGGGRGILGSNRSTVVGGDGDEGGGDGGFSGHSNEGRTELTTVEMHTGERFAQDNVTSTIASADDDLDMLLDDLTGAEMAGGGPGRQVALANTGRDPNTNAISSQATSSDIPPESSRWEQVLGAIQSRWQSSPSKSDIAEEHQSPDSCASSKSHFALEAAVLTRWKHFVVALLDHAQNSEMLPESPGSERAPERKPSRHFALSGPAVSQRGDLFSEAPVSSSTNTTRPGSWPGSFAPCRNFGTVLKDETPLRTDPVTRRDEEERESEKVGNIFQDCSPQSIHSTEWVIDATNIMMEAEDLDESPLNGESGHPTTLLETHGKEHEQQDMANMRNCVVPSTSPALEGANPRRTACEDTTITSFALDDDDEEDPLAHLGVGDSDGGASSDSIVQDIGEELLEDSSEVVPATLEKSTMSRSNDMAVEAFTIGDSSDDEQVETPRDPSTRRSFDPVIAGIASTFPDLVADAFEDECHSRKIQHTSHSSLHTDVRDNVGANSTSNGTAVTETVATTSLVRGGMLDDSEEESDEGASSDGSFGQHLDLHT